MDFIGHCATTGKRSYMTRADARKTARFHRDHVSVYRCEVCNLWHVGHLADGIIRGDVTRTDVYQPVRHARPDNTSPEDDRLTHLREARRQVATGRRSIRGVTRAQAVAAIDAEIMRVAETLIGA